MGLIIEKEPTPLCAPRPAAWRYVPHVVCMVQKNVRPFLAGNSGKNFRQFFGNYVAKPKRKLISVKRLQVVFGQGFSCCPYCRGIRKSES